MKTSWGKPVHVISFMRTLLIVLAVAVCTVAAEDLETVRKKAEAGDADAQNNLGLMYDNGWGVPKDYAEALTLWLIPENAIKWCELGLCLAPGRGVRRNDAEALKWVRMAAEQGYAPALKIILGLMYATGHDDDCHNRDIIKRELTPSQLEKGQAMAREIFERIEKRKAAEAK